MQKGKRIPLGVLWVVGRKNDAFHKTLGDLRQEILSMSEKPKPQVFYVQDPFTEEVHGPLSASDLKQRFFGGLLDGWGVSKSTTGPWTPASQVKGLRQPTAPSPESDT